MTDKLMYTKVIIAYCPLRMESILKYVIRFILIYSYSFLYFIIYKVKIRTTMKMKIRGNNVHNCGSDGLTKAHPTELGYHELWITN